jgi:hypothetical protein
MSARASSPHPANAVPVRSVPSRTIPITIGSLISAGFMSFSFVSGELLERFQLWDRILHDTASLRQ